MDTTCETAGTQRITQQTAEQELGLPEGSVCAPTAFYIEAQRLGYPVGEGLIPFIKEVIDAAETTEHPFYTSRPDLSRFLREHFRMRIVSWSAAYTVPDIEQMRQRGYLQFDEEVAFFKEHVEGKSVFDLINAGYHVIATMSPGFGSNSDRHAVILQRPSEDKLYSQTGTIEVIDPDCRNPYTLYSADEIAAGLLPEGAVSIVLPPAS